MPEALSDRSSRPHRSPRPLAVELQERICDCRRKTGWGPRLVGGATGFAHSTVWKVLKRAGISRRRPTLREPANSYEWPCPGDLLHMDISRYARFLRPGHRVTGDRSQRSRNWMRPETRVGYDFAHAIVDDHSRLATTRPTSITLGHRLFPNSGGWIDNYPEQNLANGRTKLNNTGGRYKDLVWAIKRLEAELVEDGALADEYPGYLIECLIYNVPNDLFGGARKWPRPHPRSKCEPALR